MIKSLLENEDIIFFFKGEEFNIIKPFVQPAILMVQNDQVQETQDILQDLTIHYYTFSLNDFPVLSQLFTFLLWMLFSLI